MATLIVTAKLNDVDPQAWLADVMARIADRHDRHARRARLVHAAPVEAFHQRLQLRRREPHDAGGDRRPAELAVLQLLGQEADPSAVEVDELDPVGASRPE